MPVQALELSFRPCDEEAVIAQWEALRGAGLPSQADHSSMANAPHVTFVAANHISPDAVDRARDLVGPLLPARLEVRGFVLFGYGSRSTLALLVEPDSALAEAVARVRACVPEERHPVWTPHVTLARRVPRSRLATAFEVLNAADGPRELVCDRVRWWDPYEQVIDDVASVR